MTNNRPVVLCVDDDWQTLQVLKKIMSRLPVTCLAASDAYEAVELARRTPPQLLLLDLMLPDADGWQVLEAIRREPTSDGMRVMVVTAKDSQAERLLALNVARVDAYLPKPFDIGELVQQVIYLLGLPEGR